MANDFASIHPDRLPGLLQEAAKLSDEASHEAQLLYATWLVGGNAPSEDAFAEPPTIDAAASVVPATVMFVDLRDFTALVEEYPPNQVVAQLNEYFSVMTRIILTHGGVLDKYMGDEIMAYFECRHPLEYLQAAYRAVQAGLKMLEALDALNRSWQQRGWPPLKCGIGINSGPVLKGNIGSLVKLETTIIGDTVNVASRLQQLNKTYNACLLISGSTYKLVQEDVSAHPLGELAIRGKRHPVDVYEVARATEKP